MRSAETREGRTRTPAGCRRGALDREASVWTLPEQRGDLVAREVDGLVELGDALACFRKPRFRLPQLHRRIEPLGLALLHQLEEAVALGELCLGDVALVVASCSWM